MFVYLSKLLPLFVYPLGLILLLLILALILQRKHKKAVLWLLVAMLVLVLVAGNRLVSASLVRSLEWRYLPSATIPQRDVIVLLGGGTESPDYPRPITEVNGAGDRVYYAAALYKEGKAPAILVSGGNVDFRDARGTTPAQEMQSILMQLGVPQEAIWLEDQSQNTYENALYSAQILKEKQIDAIILVTSAMHMPRSVPLFEAQGLQVIPAPADYTLTEKYWQEMTSFKPAEIPFMILPTSGALNQTSTVMKEYIGMLVYRMRGWME